MSKHWDYEDDHDWDDGNITEGSSSNALGWIFLAIAGIGAVGYGIHKKIIPAIKRKI